MNWRKLIIAAVLLLGACASPVPPEETVERYIQAKVSGDANTLRLLLCAEMEAQLDREARTFDTVTGVEIEDMQCTAAGDNTVTCTGQIVAGYGTEDTTFPLSSYRVVQEDGEWKWCGEA
jgi:hypothetical protein